MGSGWCRLFVVGGELVEELDQGLEGWGAVMSV